MRHDAGVLYTMVGYHTSPIDVLLGVGGFHAVVFVLSVECGLGSSRCARVGSCRTAATRASSVCAELLPSCAAVESGDTYTVLNSKDTLHMKR